jgi:hypothetical protein
MQAGSIRKMRLDQQPGGGTSLGFATPESRQIQAIVSMGD